MPSSSNEVRTLCMYSRLYSTAPRVLPPPRRSQAASIWLFRPTCSASPRGGLLVLGYGSRCECSFAVATPSPPQRSASRPLCRLSPHGSPLRYTSPRRARSSQLLCASSARMCTDAASPRRCQCRSLQRHACCMPALSLRLASHQSGRRACVLSPPKASQSSTKETRRIPSCSTAVCSVHTSVGRCIRVRVPRRLCGETPSSSHLFWCICSGWFSSMSVRCVWLRAGAWMSLQE